LTIRGRASAAGSFNGIQGNEKFPDMKKLCDDVHALGLKIGIYSTPWSRPTRTTPAAARKIPRACGKNRRLKEGAREQENSPMGQRQIFLRNQ